ncbi:MAG: hypothetical protein CSA97_00585 [Bacteroidetes bacterium]|nr:MAG: hypothetical protein CSA97_00585 [Bacteroidota bacterium]
MQFDETKEYTREELIGFCRYYKGEENSPFPVGENGENQNENMLWFYESVWVSELMQGLTHSYHIDEYRAYGVDRLMPDDGVPEGIKALLFDRWARGASMADAAIEFPKFYAEYYP